MFLIKSITSHPATLASSLLYLLEMGLFAVLLCSSLSSLWTMLSPLHSLSPISLNPAQFRLLRLHPNSPGFSQSPDPKPRSPAAPASPLPGPLLSSPALSVTPVNMSHHSWLSSPGSPGSPMLGTTPPPASTSTNLRSGQYPHSPSTPLTDTHQLAAYLSNYSQWEAAQSMGDQDTGSQSSQPGSALLWQGHGYNSSGRTLDFSPSVPVTRDQCTSSHLHLQSLSTRAAPPTPTRPRSRPRPGSSPTPWASTPWSWSRGTRT